MPLKTRACVSCGASLPPPEGRGRPPAYCSATCRRATINAKARDQYGAGVRYSIKGPSIPCAKCGKLTWRCGKRHKQPAERRCRDCGWAGLRPTKVKPKPPRACDRCGCDIATRPRAKFCTPCARQKEIERYRDKCRRRRATVRGLPSEPYTTEEIAARDDFRCGICSLPVDMTLKAPDFGSPSIDHKVPIAAGGADTKANVQLAHLNCNARKGCTVEVAA